jgi:hypothetical protein
MALKPEPAASGAEKTAKRRILVVDDHLLVCEALAELINRQTDLICCGQAASATEVEAAIAAHRPDLLLLDLRLGDADGRGRKAPAEPGRNRGRAPDKASPPCRTQGSGTSCRRIPRGAIPV